ncbi:hypothetical protein [Mucilaginibacter lappiensis]|nr:hypothetical protein [Mucilaginibacter lappiensis]
MSIAQQLDELLTFGGLFGYGCTMLKFSLEKINIALHYLALQSKEDEQH